MNFFVYLCIAISFTILRQNPVLSLLPLEHSRSNGVAFSDWLVYNTMRKPKRPREFYEADLAGEEWKNVYDPRFNTKYLVSNFGRVRSIKLNILIRPAIDTDGYALIVLNNKKERKWIKIHRLVLATFSGDDPRPINHLDEDKLNNKLSNLEYCTIGENLIYSAIRNKQKHNSPHTSTHLGIRKRKAPEGSKRKSWEARGLKIAGKSPHLGTFHTEEEAIRAFQLDLINRNITNQYLELPEVN